MDRKANPDRRIREILFSTSNLFRVLIGPLGRTGMLVSKSTKALVMTSLVTIDQNNRAWIQVIRHNDKRCARIKWIVKQMYQ